MNETAGSGRRSCRGRYGDLRVAQPAVPTTDTQWIPLPPGDYIAELTEHGRVARSVEIMLAPGERRPFQLLHSPANRVQRSIVAMLPKRGGLPDASETLRGPLVDQDTSMWLSILGASRLIDRPSNFSKLGPLALATFEDLAPGESAVYALAGARNARHRHRCECELAADGAGR